MRFWVSALLMLFLVVLPSSAWADEAADLKAKGDAALVSGNALDALVAYKEAYAKNHDPALLYNMGRAQQNLGDVPAAVDAYEDFDRNATPELRARVPGLPGLLKELRVKVSQLAVSSNVDGATVAVRGKPVGKTPIGTATRVMAGHATVEVTKDGYFPYKTEIELPSAGLATVTAKLSSKAASGLLVVTSPITGALVAVDGSSAGNAPTESVVGVGSHRIDVTREGFKSASSTVDMKPGEKKTVDLSLEKEGTVFGKWWFWTGVGVVVAGGVVAAILLTREGDPREGTIAPGHIPAALTF